MLDEAALWNGRRFQYLRGDTSDGNSNEAALRPLLEGFEGSMEEAWVAAFNELVGINYAEDESTLTAQVAIGGRNEAGPAARRAFEQWARTDLGKRVEWLPDLEF